MSCSLFLRMRTLRLSVRRWRTSTQFDNAAGNGIPNSNTCFDWPIRRQNGHCFKQRSWRPGGLLLPVWCSLAIQHTPHCLICMSAFCHSALLLKRGEAAQLTLQYQRAQGAALAMESASILSTLLRHISSVAVLPDILASYQSLRVPRARRTKQRSRQMHDMCQLDDGPAQMERDRILREDKPAEGFPNPWADPEFQEWMWAFDARTAAESAWEDFISTRMRPQAP